MSSVRGSEASPNVQNNEPIDADDADLVNLLVGADIASANDLIDTWGVSTLSDGAFFDQFDNLRDGTEFQAFFLTLDTSLYSDVSYKPVPPRVGTVELAGFFIEEADAGGNTVFLAAGLLHTFVDARPGDFAFTFIETLAASGITAGCGGNNYCPGDTVTRAQMAIFLERGINGGAYIPPPATGNVFLDVQASDFAASFIEQLFLDGITGGCGGNNYCRNDPVTRAQMAIFLLRAKHGSGFVPPPANGIFTDVPLGSFAVAWIEQLAAEGITSGCGGGNYCPGNPVTRAQMAVFLVRAFVL